MRVQGHLEPRVGERDRDPLRLRVGLAGREQPEALLPEDIGAAENPGSTVVSTVTRSPGENRDRCRWNICIASRVVSTPASMAVGSYRYVKQYSSSDSVSGSWKRIRRTAGEIVNVTWT